MQQHQQQQQGQQQQGQQQQQQGSQQSQAPGQNERAENDDGLNKPRRNLGDAKRSEWDNPRERARKIEALSALKKQFPARYQQLIEQYYEDLQTEDF